MYQLHVQKYWDNRDLPCHFEFRNPQVPFPSHSHDFHEICIVYSGSGTHITPQGNYEIQAGDIISVKPGQQHGYKKINNLVLMNVLVQSSFFVEDPFELSAVPGYGALFEQNARSINSAPIHFRLNQLQLFEIRAIIESIQQEINNQTPGYIPQSAALFLQLLVFMLRVYGNKDFSTTNVKNNASILIKHIEKNFRKSITMQELVDISGLSESSILRTFKRVTGYPPFVYQNRIRMFAAINDLISTNKDITQIALDTGFSDSNYFSRSFKKFMKMTPTEYRTQFATSETGNSDKNK
ncbi:MAG: helix-turn-helix domain-containing protein [Treponema sp.]|nr:helix-turn-helix domain-containing protein [Treponema sp.]